MGKTEAVVAFAGPGARHATHHIFNELGSKVAFQSYPIVDGNLTSHVLNVVDSYKHLGSRMTATANVHPEIKQRLASMNASLPAFSRRVLRMHSMPPEDRAVYAKGYMFAAKGLYNSATWPTLSVSEHKSIHIGIMKVLRRILIHNPTAHTHITDTDILT